MRCLAASTGGCRAKQGSAAATAREIVLRRIQVGGGPRQHLRAFRMGGKGLREFQASCRRLRLCIVALASPDSVSSCLP